MSKGILTKAGARRLNVEGLSGHCVFYRERWFFHEGKAVTFAEDVYWQGVRIGGTLALGEEGIVPMEGNTDENTGA